MTTDLKIQYDKWVKTNLTWIILGGLIGLLAIGALVLALNKSGNLRLFSGKTSILTPFSASQKAKGAKIILPCPIEQKPCPVGEIIEPSVQNSQFMGVGYSNLSAGVKVLSGSAGEIVVQTDKDTKKVTLSIIRPEQNLQINYAFKGTSQVSNKLVNAKDVIGVLSGEVLGQKVFGKDYSLIISVLDLQTREYIKIISAPEGIVIEP